ncbi:hypothetical protein LAV73_11990 [Lysinibacillus xylanilyticus]|uniref:CdiA C-terminal domain-containing protein n=1 Tax=Lysinibacillus xylanilyticus TaxID=582475 RepID=UPI002B241DCF|nr:hypothetical protein [Lysinibacillus xylanilyticus]MEB2280718.1 hypothetical protein [Lysinibacillus xylanilyticus]
MLKNTVQKGKRWVQQKSKQVYQKTKQVCNKGVDVVKTAVKEAAKAYKPIETMETLKITEDMSIKEKLLRKVFNKALIKTQIKKGQFDATVDIAKDLYGEGKKIAANPIGYLDDLLAETVEGAYNLALHPVQTATGILYSVKDPFERDVINGNAYSRSYWITKTRLNIAKELIGRKGTGFLKGIPMPNPNPIPNYNGILPDSKQPNPSKDPKKPEETKDTVSTNLTEPSLPNGSKPKGEYTKGDSHGVKKENETADFLANKGYEIKMLNEVNGGNGHGIKATSNPDFLIEGKVFDCYAPTPNTKTDNVLRTITTKTKTQAERIVLNVDNFPPEKILEITEGIQRKANPNGDLKNLKELLIVNDGKITRVFGEEK